MLRPKQAAEVSDGSPLCGRSAEHQASAVTAALGAGALAPMPAMDTSSYSTSDRL